MLIMSVNISKDLSHKNLNVLLVQIDPHTIFKDKVKNTSPGNYYIYRSFITQLPQAFLEFRSIARICNASNVLQIKHSRCEQCSLSYDKHTFCVHFVFTNPLSPAVRSSSALQSAISWFLWCFATQF